MHSMYVLAREGNAVNLMKLFVEEALVGHNSTDAEVALRAYELKGIKKVAVLTGGVLQQGTGLNPKSTTDISVADLFALVKQYDTNFSPKPVDPATINPDGTPKLAEQDGVTGYINGDGQFKAADNLGSFNASDPDIRHSRRSDTLLSEEKTFRELFRKLGLTLTVGGTGYAANPEKRSSYSNTRTGGAHVFDSQDGRAYAREIAKQAGFRLKLTNDPVVDTRMIPSMDPAELAGLSPMQQRDAAVAEFVNRWLYDPAAAKDFAGTNFFNAFEEGINGLGWGGNLREAQERLRRLYDAEAYQRLAARVDLEAEPVQKKSTSPGSTPAPTVPPSARPSGRLPTAPPPRRALGRSSWASDRADHRLTLPPRTRPATCFYEGLDFVTQIRAAYTQAQKSRKARSVDQFRYDLTDEEFEDAIHDTELLYKQLGETKKEIAALWDEYAEYDGDEDAQREIRIDIMHTCMEATR